MAPKARVLFDSAKDAFIVQEKGWLFWTNTIDSWDKTRKFGTFKEALKFASKCSVLVIVEHSAGEYNEFKT